MAEQNPHIPKFIKDAPWYTSESSKDDKAALSNDYLSHHRSGKETQSNAEPRIGQGITDSFIKDVDTKSGPVFKKRCTRAKCVNCGSMDHDKRECLEKPKRKREVHATHNEGQDKGKRNENLDYDGKRDRWYGYDVNDYDAYVKKFEERRAAQAEDSIVCEFDIDEEIELKELGLWEEGLKREQISCDVSVGEGEPGKVVRLREDRAVYLQDVRNESITYDPKSRRVRDDSQVLNATDGQFVKLLTGDAKEFEASKKFAWDETKRGLQGTDNYVSNPTLAERKMKQQSEQQKLKSTDLKNKLLGVYGATDSELHGTNPLLTRENNTSLQPGDQDQQDDVVRSRYDEDVYMNNHTSVWGSWYTDGAWGYRCCKSTVRGELCK